MKQSCIRSPLLRFAALLLIIACSDHERPLSSNAKPTQDGILGTMGDFEVEEDESSDSDTESGTESSSSSRDGDLLLNGGDLDGDGEISDEEEIEIAAFQDACYYITESILYDMPDILASNPTRSRSVRFSAPYQGSVMYRYNKDLNFSNYNLFGLHKVTGSLNLQSDVSQGVFIVKQVRGVRERNDEYAFHFIIGARLRINKKRGNLFVEGQFADVGTPALIAATPQLIHAFRSALVLSRDTYNTTVRGNRGGQLSISGNERIRWVFDDFADSRNIRLDGTINNIRLSYPVRILSTLQVNIRSDLARGKVAGVTPGVTRTETDSEVSFVDVQDLVSVDRVPRGINPLTDFAVNTNMTLHRVGTTGTVTLAGQSRDIEYVRSNPRTAYYDMPRQHR